MAKQTFTTGQVLTAAQMTSLQQTAMLGGSASAKVASYTLVAADAGTTVSMSNASATTITVNTGLFASGDTVTILNTGAGTCTITAGTATVSKATNATLALVTNAGGVLYFTATGAATFLPFDVGSGSTSPLTTKGDLFGYDTANARIPIGTNNQVLTADSAQALGVKWATPAGATKNFSLLGTGTLTAAGATTVTVSGISGIDQIFVLILNASAVSASSEIRVQINGDTASNYYNTRVTLNNNSTYSTSILTSNGALNQSSVKIGTMDGTAGSSVSGYFQLNGCNTAGKKLYIYAGSGNSNGGNDQQANWGGGYWDNSATVTSISINSNTNLDAGSYQVWGSA